MYIIYTILIIDVKVDI